MLVEQLDQLGEVGQRPGQPVDLVDHDDVDLAGPDLGEQRLQGRAVERGAREGAIVIVVGDQPPALVRLALDIGLAGLPLGIERVELQVEVMVGRFAGVDRAAEQLSWRGLSMFGSTAWSDSAGLDRGAVRAGVGLGAPGGGRSSAARFGVVPTGHPQSKEARAIPGRAGDGPRDGRKARIGRVLPDEAIRHDRDGVALALVFADQHGAGLEAAAEFAWASRRGPGGRGA